MRLVFLSHAALVVFAFSACSNTITTSSSTGGSSATGKQTTNATTGTGATSGTQSTTGAQTTSGTASTGSGGPHGCKTSADCNGKQCVPLTPGGFQVCLTPPPEATMCQNQMADQCCTTADCATKGGGSCYAAMNLQFCGGAQLLSNRCVTDGCMSNADCVMSSAPAICAPAGAFSEPKRQCLAAYCKTDADCTAMPSGACLAVGNNDCCKLSAPFGLACVYPGDCVTNADCGGQQHQCGINMTTGRSECQMAVGCPG